MSPLATICATSADGDVATVTPDLAVEVEQAAAGSLFKLSLVLVSSTIDGASSIVSLESLS
jgi:hypothetical protein